jgi:hypothetical protein
VTTITLKTAAVRAGKGKQNNPPGGVTIVEAPPFLRLPKPKERCPYSQLSRTTLAEMCVPTAANNFRPAVRALCIKTTATKKGGKPARAKKRGIYLIPTAKLFAYLNSRPAA